ncbi:right-handed parallel beta-helix repeat-containing protein [bacterium]|nr:right-handed parallel beta-helix repeat-containing protein [bacterium]
MRPVPIVALAGFLVVHAASAVTLAVPDAFDTITSALAEAVAGDTVLVRPGTYPEHLFMVDGVVLRGDDPLDRPVVDGTGSGIVLTATGCGNTTRVEGLVLRNGAGGGLGGGAALGNAALVFSDCDFLDNSAFQGGGIGATTSSFRVERCRFTGNLAGQSGGAIAMTDAGAPTILDCTFRDNTALAGGALAIRNGCNPAIFGCLFAGNVAGQGAALWYDFLTGGTLENCTIVNGAATGLGGILYFGAFSSPLVERTIVAFGDGGGAIFAVAGATAVLGCNCVFGNAGGDELLGGLDLGTNFSEDPLFCDPAANDYRLSEASPCLPDGPCALVGAFDAGCPALPAPEPATTMSWGSLKAAWR